MKCCEHTLNVVFIILYAYAGDLGQSFDSNSTLSHYESNPIRGETVLFVGDLSYADNYPNHDNVKWDTWGRFVERSVAYQPWIWTTGNHEIDFAPEIVSSKLITSNFFFYFSYLFFYLHMIWHLYIMQEA